MGSSPQCAARPRSDLSPSPRVARQGQRWKAGGSLGPRVGSVGQEGLFLPGAFRNVKYSLPEESQTLDSFPSAKAAKEEQNLKAAAPPWLFQPQIKNTQTHNCMHLVVTRPSRPQAHETFSTTSPYCTAEKTEALGEDVIGLKSQGRRQGSTLIFWAHYQRYCASTGRMRPVGLF